MMKTCLCRVVFLIAATCTCVWTSHLAADDQTLDLSGSWSFQMDPEDAGIANGWFERTLDQTIHLPGSMQAQGFGEQPSLDTKWTGSVRPEVLQMPRYAPYRDADNFKMPFWLQPKHYYAGPAWYERTVTIAPDWNGRRITLHLERCHWLTTVWVDGHEVGQGESLSVPHVFDLTEQLSPGRASPHDSRGQPRADRRGRELPQRHGSHADQLERHRGTRRTSRQPPRLDRRRAGLSRRGGAVGTDPSHDPQSHRAHRHGCRLQVTAFHKDEAAASGGGRARRRQAISWSPT